MAFRDERDGACATPECEMMLNMLYDDYRANGKITHTMQKLKLLDENEIQPNIQIQQLQCYQNAFETPAPFTLGVFQLFGGYFRNWFRSSRREVQLPAGYTNRILDRLMSYYFELGVCINTIKYYPRADALHNEIEYAKGKHYCFQITKELFEHMQERESQFKNVYHIKNTILLAIKTKEEVYNDILLPMNVVKKTCAATLL